MRTVFVCTLLALTAARAAADCDPKAKPIFTRDEKPLHGGAAKSFAITASGAWTRDGATGCLTDARRKLVEDAVAKAKFELNKKAKRCRVAPMTHVVYAAPGRKLRVEHDEPCGPPFDQATGLLLTCADMVVDPAATDDDLARLCLGLAD